MAVEGVETLQRENLQQTRHYDNTTPQEVTVGDIELWEGKEEKDSLSQFISVGDESSLQGEVTEIEEVDTVDREGNGYFDLLPVSISINTICTILYVISLKLHQIINL